MKHSTAWRVLYAATLILMLSAASSQLILKTISFYPRYAALGLLALATFHWHPRPGLGIKQMTLPARTLVNGMCLATVLAATSTLWSVDPLLTAQQTVALAAVAMTLYALISRRWINGRLVSGDLAVAFWTTTVFFALGLVGYAIGMPGMQAAAGFDGYQFVNFRYQGLASNPNMLSVLCTPVVPLAWHLYRARGRRIYLIGALPAVASVLMSQSRTALLALGAGAVLVLVRRGPKSMMMRSLAGAGVLGLGYLSGIFQAVMASDLVAEITGRFESQAGGGVLNGRSQAWAETVRLIWAQPAYGYGYSAGPSLFEQLRSSGDLAFGRDVAHNSYLQWLLETGVLGLPALAMLTIACLAGAWRTGANRETAGLGWCLLAGLIMQATESAMLGTGQAYPAIFWVVAAAAGAGVRHDVRKIESLFDREVASVPNAAEPTVERR